MDHLLLKAATTVATDQGEFEAVISTDSVDREGDIIEPSAIVKALGKWAALGKLMPLVYSHRDPKTGHSIVVGDIKPASARVQGREVVAKGWVDQATERGAETWRLVKSGTLSFSYGYLVPEGGATKRAGKQQGYHIRDIDLYEVSVVPVAPANNDTRVMWWKGLPDPEDQRKRVQELAREVEEDRLPDLPEPDEKATVVPDGSVIADPEGAEDEGDPSELLGQMISQAQDFIDDEDDPQDVQAMREIMTRLLQLQGAEATEPKALDAAELRQKADALALEVAHGGEPPKAEPKHEPDQLQEVKDELAAVTAQVKELVETQKKAAEATGKETKSRSVDPLRQKADALALEFASDGESLRKPPRPDNAPTPEPRFTPEELREQTRELILLSVLSGVDET